MDPGATGNFVNAHYFVTNRPTSTSVVKNKESYTIYYIWRVWWPQICLAYYTPGILGIEIDTNVMEIRLPADKLSHF